jgi:hypothetical protein
LKNVTEGVEMGGKNSLTNKNIPPMLPANESNALSNIKQTNIKKFTRTKQKGGKV